MDQSVQDFLENQNVPELLNNFLNITKYNKINR